MSLATNSLVCTGMGCTGNAAVRVELPDGRTRVVCHEHVTGDAEVLAYV